jgi:hypothetical protein
MGSITEQLTEALSIPVQPLYAESATFDNTNALTVPPSGDGVDMRSFRRILGIVALGVGAPNNGTAKIYGYWTGSNTNNGTYTAFTTNTNISLNTNNSMGTLELRADQLPAGNRFVKLNVLVPVANANLSAMILAGAAADKPASSFDFTTNVSLLERTVY